MARSDEITAADIARLAGVGRAAVSNWRRRHPDFPRPVGGPPTSPTFSLKEVEAWLTANGRAATPTAPPASADATSHRPTDGTLHRAMAALLTPLDTGTIFDLTAPTSDETAVPPSGDLADAIISVAPPAEVPITGLITWEFGLPSRTDHQLGWVQRCLAALRPGGTAVVAVPFGVAVRASGRRIRAELLRAGVLTHVIGLPEKLTLPGAAGPWQLWLFTRPAGRPTYTLRLVDLSGQTPDDLPQTSDAWAEIFTDPHRTRDLPAIELLDEDVLLIPGAHVATPPRDFASEYQALRDQYHNARNQIAEAAPMFRPGERASDHHLVSIGDLMRSGAVTLVDREAIRPGDVLVPARTHGFEAWVAGPETGSNSGSGAASDQRPLPAAGSVLRCDPQLLDPYFLACFLRSETNRRQASGTSGGTFRLDLRRARIPHMTLKDQRRYGEAFRRLMAFAGAAEELATTAAAATRTAIDALTTGTFDPEEQ